MKESVDSIENALMGKLNYDRLLELVPELASTVGCQQNHPGHDLDVFETIL